MTDYEVKRLSAERLAELAERDDPDVQELLAYVRHQQSIINDLERFRRIRAEMSTSSSLRESGHVQMIARLEQDNEELRREIELLRSRQAEKG